MSPRIRIRRGEKCRDGEMMDSFLIVHLLSRSFFLERLEWRVGQFKFKVSKIGRSDHHFVHNLAANPWMVSNLSGWLWRLDLVEY